MSMIENLNYLTGYELSLKNAKNLNYVARTCQDKHQLGIANSLFVLSSEESVKAITCAIQHRYPDTVFDKRIFGSHEVKHKKIKEQLYIFKIFPRIIVGALNGAGDRELKDFFSFVLAILDSLKKQNGMAAKFKNYWDSANDQKKWGFYVDIKGNQTWHDPSSIAEKQVKISGEYSDELIDLANDYLNLISKIEEVFNSSRRKHSNGQQN